MTPRRPATLALLLGALALAPCSAWGDPPMEYTSGSPVFSHAAAGRTRGGAPGQTYLCVSRVDTGKCDAQGRPIVRVRVIPAANVELGGDALAIAHWGKAPWRERKVGADFLRAERFAERFSACTTVEAGDALWNAVEAKWVAKVLAARPQDRALIEAYGKAEGK